MARCAFTNCCGGSNSTCSRRRRTEILTKREPRTKHERAKRKAVERLALGVMFGISAPTKETAT